VYQEQTFNANGVRINFVQASDQGQPLLLLHGTASEWQSFLPLIPVFAQDCKVFALDLRGHGGSVWVSGKYRLFDYAADIQCFLEQYVGQPCILYGHSLGAQVAIAVTSLAPTYVRALVLGDIPFYFHNMMMKDTLWVQPFTELHHVVSSFHSANEIDDYMADQYPTMDAQRRKDRAQTLSHVDPDVVATILADRHIEGFDTDALLRQIACRVLLIQGNPELGAALQDEDLAYMLSRIQKCEIVHMPDVGHGLPSGESILRVKKFIQSESSRLPNTLSDGQVGILQ
jgi:pimeloyl-ACP methyl ester carboxylesterase